MSELDDVFNKIEEITANQWTAVSVICRPKQADAGTAWKDGSKFCIEITYGGQGAYPGPRVYGNTVKEAFDKLTEKI